MHVEDSISRIKSRLTWGVEHTTCSDNTMLITSDPWARIHTIHMPTSGADFRNIEYLHELAHAVLAERHHLLATAWFMPGTPEMAYLKLTHSLRVASDWYADDLLMEWAPNEERAEILEHVGYAGNIVRSDSEITYAGGLFFAQGVKYCGMKRQDIPRRYRKPAEILLGVDPGKPGVEAKRKLVNQLAALTCNVRIVLGNDKGMDVWIVKQ